MYFWEEATRVIGSGAVGKGFIGDLGEVADGRGLRGLSERTST